MNVNDELNIFDPESEVQSAYDESARIEFSASSLHPWTIARHSVALSLGCQLITAVGPFVREFLDSGTYSNVYRDIVIVLWLCSLPDDDIIAMDANLRRETCMKTAYEWAESIELKYGGAIYLEGVSILDAILKQILDSFFEVDPEARGEAKKKVIGHLGKSRSRGRPRSHADSLPLSSWLTCLWRGRSNGKRSIINGFENTGSKSISPNTTGTGQPGNNLTTS